MLVIFLTALIILIALTVVFWAKLKYLGFYWKTFLNIWMNFQVFVFFYFIGVNQPCCLRYFYHILYMITVRWSYALRNSMSDDFYDNNVSGDIEYYNQPQTPVFIRDRVTAWILANMGLLFVFHCIILVAYIIVKILSFLKINQMVKGLVRIFEFTVFIVFFLMFHMQIFVFSTMNLKQFGGNNHSFFIFNLLISIAYIVIFSLFWLYSVFRMTGSNFYFQDPKHKF